MIQVPLYFLRDNERIEQVEPMPVRVRNATSKHTEIFKSRE
jgi:hypothetical protein